VLDRLVELLREFGEALLPFTVVHAYERALVLRFGILNRVLAPGFHWRWPLAEHVLSHSVVPNTSNLAPQSLTTADGRSVVLSLVLTWRVCDIAKFLLEVEGADEAIADIAYGASSRYTTATTWDVLVSDAPEEQLLKAIRKRAFRWGVEAIAVQFSDLTACRSIRLWQEQRNHHPTAR
jgi:regulator of protease activity HflC (stomatin/prohibitin superfamily)